MRRYTVAGAWKLQILLRTQAGSSSLSLVGVEETLLVRSAASDPSTTLLSTGQGLTLVHFSTQTEPFLSLKPPPN